MMAFMNGWEIALVAATVFVVGILGTVFWVWMLVDAARNHALGDNEKIVWIVIIAMTHVIGALLYLLFGRPKRSQPPIAT